MALINEYCCRICLTVEKIGPDIETAQIQSKSALTVVEDLLDVKVF